MKNEILIRMFATLKWICLKKKIGKQTLAFGIGLDVDFELLESGWNIGIGVDVTHHFSYIHQ